MWYLRKQAAAVGTSVAIDGLESLTFINFFFRRMRSIVHLSKQLTSASVYLWLSRGFSWVVYNNYPVTKLNISLRASKPNARG